MSRYKIIISKCLLTFLFNYLSGYHSHPYFSPMWAISLALYSPSRARTCNNSVTAECSTCAAVTYRNNTGNHPGGLVDRSLRDA